MGERTGHLAVDGLSRDATVTGSLAELGVLDLLQAIADTKRSAALSIHCAEQRAELFFRNGDLIDAELGTLRGERAVYAALTWTDGHFTVDFRDVPRDDAMRTSTRRVLWEGRRRLEERSRRVAQLPSLGCVFEVDCEKLLEKLAELPDEMNLVLRHFDGEKPLVEILSRCDLDELTTLSAFARLISEGVICDRHNPTQSAPADAGKGARERPAPLVSTLPPPRAKVRSTLDYELDGQQERSEVARNQPSPLPERSPGERTLRGMRAPHVATDPPRPTQAPSQAPNEDSQASERVVDDDAFSRPTVRPAPPEARLDRSSIATESMPRKRRRRRRSALSDAQPSRRLRAFATLAPNTPLPAALAAPPSVATPQRTSAPAARDPEGSAPAPRQPAIEPAAAPRSRAIPTVLALSLVGLLVFAMVWLARLAGR